MNLRVLAIAAGLAGLAFAPAASPQSQATFDPIGKWRVSTVSDEGQPMTVNVDIGGKAGAYTGQAVTGERTLPLTDLATTPTGMIAVFALPQGSIVVRMSGTGGKYRGDWGEVSETFALTAERAK